MPSLLLPFICSKALTDAAKSHSPANTYRVIRTKFSHRNMEIDEPCPQSPTPKPGDRAVTNAVGHPFDHPAHQIDQVDSEIKNMG